MQLGSIEWGYNSGGRLTRGQRWSQILQALTAQLRRASRSWLRRSGLSSGKLAAAAWKGLEIPDSPLALSADRFCREVSPHYLVDHCLRSFAWATLLAQRDDLSFDSEVLYLACMLHDLGLTDSALPQGDQLCFAVSGAQAAERFLQSQGGRPEVALLVAEAISLHLNVQVALRCGAEAHLLRQGSGMDVIGMRFHEVSPEARQQVLQRYPRADFAKQIAARLGHPCICHPGTRTHLLCQLGFLRMIRRSPWQD